MHIFTFVLVPLTAFVIAYKLIPVIIQLALERSLVDIPTGRKQHKAPTPALGGVAIFIGMLSSFCLWADFSQVAELQFTILSMFLLFFVGLKDDLSEINANHKFLIQIGLAFLISIGGLRIRSLHGLFGIEELPIVFQFVITMTFIVGLTNAYNMIDGIDGLAGGIALIASLILGTALFIMEDFVYGTFALALAGSLVGFLCFNFSPAKIFMGDTGSLSIGVLLVVFCIRFLESSDALAGFSAINSFAPVLVFSVLVVPLLDVVQVIITRKMAGNPIFTPDRNHLHHLLLKVGLSHKQAAFSLYGITIFCTAITLICLLLELPMTMVFSLLIGTLVAGIIGLRRNIAQQIDAPQHNAAYLHKQVEYSPIAKAG
ncbi:MAG: MraY family glycosyltransferase [Bacteroidota bacterium]